jgi:LytR cell envelope-related transcriptional attenuator
MEVIRQVGAIAGLAAFFGLAVLALLYFAQARDVRRLRESASFLVEGEEVGGPGVQPADRAAAAAAVAAEEPEEAAAAAAATAPDEREAFRRAELARQAAERRQRFEQRRKPGRPGFGSGQRPAWLSDGPSTVVIAIGALLLVAGLIFGATRLTGGDDEASTGGNAAGEKGGKAPPTKVAVLNGTAEAGLASEAAAPLKQQGFQTGPVTNTEEPFDASVVMFDSNAQGSEETAREVAQVAAIQAIEPMTTEIRGVSEGAAVAVVLGEDQATGSSLDGTDTTSGVEGI